MTTDSRLIPGAEIQNEGKYVRPCKGCGKPLMMARMMGPRRFGWWAFDEQPKEAGGVRFYKVHDCEVRPPAQGSLIR